MAPESESHISEQHANAWLQNALEGVGLSAIHTVSMAFGGTDLLIQTDIGSYKVELKSAGQGWPSTIQSIANAGSPIPNDVVLYARTFSTGAINEMRRIGANWVDSHGNLRLLMPPSLYIERYRPVRRDEVEHDLRWSVSTEDIAEWILTHPDDPITVDAVARSLGWSKAQTSRTLSKFDDLGWTHRIGALKGSGVTRFLTSERGAMLDSWSTGVASRKPRIRRFHALSRNPFATIRDSVANRLNDADLIWALSGLAASQALTAQLTSVPTVDMAVPTSALDGPGLWQALEEAGFKEVDEGAVFSLIELDRHVFKHRRPSDGVFVLSTPRVYATTVALGGRSGEVATTLREELIGF